MPPLPQLMRAVRRWGHDVRPERRHVRDDLVAGLPSAVASVPDGMASAVLIGVNPAYGLYASIIGPVIGGLSSSTRFMVVTTTTAAALAAGSALESVPTADRSNALFLLTIMTGLIIVAAGILRLGRYVRFVSHSVMIGFLTGVSVNIVLGQLADFSGSSAHGSTSLMKALSVFAHPGDIQLASILVGVAGIAILAILGRTRLASVSALIALILPTLAVVVFDADVARVSDNGDIPQGVPLPSIPGLQGFSPELVAGAFAVAVIILVQGAGVAESVPNPDGSASNANRDFLAQGLSNVTTGFFQGLPVGGSVGQTALNRSLGAKTRWAAIYSGLWLMVILLAFAGLVSQVAMPILSAVLIFAAIGALRPSEIASIWHTGLTSQIALVATFVATLFLPVTAAVGVGVGLSLLLQLNSEAMDLRVVERVTKEDGRIIEIPAPRTLRSNDVIVLNVYGSLLYAGSRTLAARLPKVSKSEHAAVVLRLRGRTSLGATFFTVISDYAHQIANADGQLYLSGLAPEPLRQLQQTGAVDLTGPVHAIRATTVVGESTANALHDAQAWLVEHPATRNDKN